MQNYELTCLISPDLNEKDLEALFEQARGIINEEGKIAKAEAPKKIKLAYSIRKKEEAFLASFEFQAEPSNAQGLKGKLEKIPQLLRFSVIKKETPKTRTRKETKKTISIKEIIGSEAPQEPAEKQEKTFPEKKVGLEEIEEDLKKIIGFSSEGEPEVKPEL